jgi:tight adherence protein C
MSGRTRRAPRIGAAVAVSAAALVGGRRALVVGLVVAAVVRITRHARAGRRQRAIGSALTDAVPLLQLAVQAGLTVRASVAAVVPWLDPVLADAFRDTLHDVEAGVSLADALDELPRRLGPACGPLVAVLGPAERYGAPLVEPLARLGSELRLQRRRQLESAARRLPVALLLPLVTGVLPAFGCLVVAPLLATSLHGVSLTGSG